MNKTQSLQEELQALRATQAECDARIKKLHRARAAQNTWWLMVLLVGMAVGFALAEWLIDPVTILPACGGVEV